MSRFGSPKHYSIRFDDRYFSFPNGIHFDNLHNNIKVWRENILANRTYPSFTSWVANRIFPTESEDDIDSVIKISDSESEEDEDEETLKDFKPTASKARLETLWKLYRNIGETVEDMKSRLLDCTPSNNENIDEDNLMSEENLPIKCLKEEFEYNEFDYVEKEEQNSNPSIASSDQVDVKSIKVSIKLENIKSEYIEGEACTDFSNYNFDDFLNVQLDERSETVELSDIDIKNPSLKSWSCRDSDCWNRDCTYNVPRLKQITNEELVTEAKSKSNKRKNESVCKSEEQVPKKSKRDPIICDMYGTRTINYDESPTQVKLPSAFKTSRLSGSSCDEEIELVEFGKSTAVALKNRFQNNKRKRVVRSTREFFNSFALDLSNDSDSSTQDSHVVRKKRVKVFCDENALEGFNGKVSQGEIEEQIWNFEPASSCTTNSSSYTCTRTSCSCSTCSTTASSSDELGN